MMTTTQLREAAKESLESLPPEQFKVTAEFLLGDYRVIYRIDDGQQLVAVLKIAHRSDVYE